MLKLLPLFTPIANFLEGAIDSVRDSVIPVKGSVVYCDLAFGYAEHSGIYVGNNEIVHLNGRGNVEAVSPKEFMRGTTAVNIYVSCEGRYAVGNESIAAFAKQQLFEYRSYNFLLDNCHMFTSGCLSGNFNNSHSFMWLLKDEAKSRISADTWRHWDTDFY